MGIGHSLAGSTTVDEPPLFNRADDSAVSGGARWCTQSAQPEDFASGCIDVRYALRPETPLPIR